MERSHSRPADLRMPPLRSFAEIGSRTGKSVREGDGFEPRCSSHGCFQVVGHPVHHCLRQCMDGAPSRFFRVMILDGSPQTAMDRRYCPQIVRIAALLD
jgi:hypothetical protein